MRYQFADALEERLEWWNACREDGNIQFCAVGFIMPDFQERRGYYIRLNPGEVDDLV